MTIASLKNPTESGASIIEVLMSASILLGSLTAGFAYVQQSTSEVKARNAVTETTEVETSLVAFVRSVIAAEAKTDPCLSVHTLHVQIGKLAGMLTPDLAVTAFNPDHVPDYKKFIGATARTEWNEIFNFCNKAGANKSCVVLEKKIRDGKRKRLAVAMVTQTTYDFKIGKPVAAGSCDNSKILNVAETSSDFTGIGIKAKYILMTGTLVDAGQDSRLVSRKAVGEVFQTSSKAKISAGGGEFDPKRSPSCTHAFCAGVLPPDPGTNYAAWSAFRGPSTYASDCEKCENAPDYK